MKITLENKIKCQCEELSEHIVKLLAVIDELQPKLDVANLKLQATLDQKETDKEAYLRLRSYAP